MRQVYYSGKRKIALCCGYLCAILANMWNAGQTIRGTVVRGLGAATRLGFPTVNISKGEYHRNKHEIQMGVYAGVVAIRSSSGQEKKYKAGIVVGPNKIEAHLLGFGGALYGKRIAFTFTRRLRDMRVFKNRTLLKEQIRKDLDRVERLVSLSKEPLLF